MFLSCNRLQPARISRLQCVPDLFPPVSPMIGVLGTRAENPAGTAIARFASRLVRYRRERANATAPSPASDGSAYLVIIDADGEGLVVQLME
jgi:hypothetical protein